jgi:PadR family transcriptional regulator PadR
VTEGTVYPILGRLTRQGLLRSEWVAAEGPHPRKYYELTQRGRRRLEEMLEHWRSFAGKIERLIAARREER